MNDKNPPVSLTTSVTSFQRKLDIKARAPHKSFFLWGQRQTGKSTLLKTLFGNNAYWINLLETNTFLDYATHPHLLRERLRSLPAGQLIIIDEVQKVPLLLDEVQHLIESQKLVFGLCGSSARKLKRGHGNLLGGRARRFELYGLSLAEIMQQGNMPQDKMNIVNVANADSLSAIFTQLLNRGYLPNFYLDSDYFFAQQSYVADYLKEEILAESLIRNIHLFHRFLEVAAHCDTEAINFSTIARDVGVTSKTVQAHYEILCDTLTGHFLFPYMKKAKRQMKKSPKFYFSDVGIVNFLAKRKQLIPRTPAFGKAMENWVFHELKCYQAYQQPDLEISYWAPTNGCEVDFILNDMEVAIEVKGSDRITTDHLKNLKMLKADHPKIKKLCVVSLEQHSRVVNNQIHLLNYMDFTNMLWAGELIGQ